MNAQRVIEFIIVYNSNSSKSKLDSEIRKKIKEGFEPFGPTSVTANKTLIQKMVKYRVIPK